MKQAIKKETAILDLIHEMRALLMALDKKVDSLIFRSIAETSPIPKHPVVTASLPIKPNDRHKVRMVHTAVCADCKKECKIPFKPTGDRPVYCQDCFSRRKVISLSRIGLDPKPNEAQPAQMPSVNEIKISKSTVKTKKKTVKISKPAAKNKIAPKKK